MQPGPGYPNQYAPQPPTKKGMSTCLIVAIVVGILGVLGVGVLASLSIYGTRRYLAAAKTAEAKNTIGAIARGARASYERETESGGHALCKSATTVPAKVPSGVKYQPMLSGGDFDTGSDTEGWKCLRFSMTQPIYYQYSYRQGSGYINPGASPGPDSFEASAQGDIDGDGDYSKFALGGRVSGGVLTVDTSIYVFNEFE